jgi:hypothetical protein
MQDDFSKFQQEVNRWLLAAGLVLLMIPVYIAVALAIMAFLALDAIRSWDRTTALLLWTAAMLAGAALAANPYGFWTIVLFAKLPQVIGVRF